MNGCYYAIEEDIKILENCWVMTTKHSLDKENKALKTAMENVIERLRELEEEKEQLLIKNKDISANLEITVAMITRGSYPAKNKEDNDFEKQFILRKEIKELQKENEKKIEEMRPYKHTSPFDFGVLNGIDEAYRKLLKE